MRISLLLALIATTSCVRQYPEKPPCPPTKAPCHTCGKVMSRIKSQGQPYPRGGLDERSQVASAKGVGNARVFLKMKEGSLWAKGGSKDLVSAELKYPRGEEAPTFFSLTAGQMRQIDIGSNGPGEEWHLEFNEEVPITLAIEAEGGDRNLQLHNVPLQGFYLQAMEGTTFSAPSGNQPYLTELDISHDNGAIALDLSGSYPILAKASIYTSNGDVAGKFTGYYSRLEELDVVSVEGNVELDLTGAWRRNVRMKVRATCGDCTLCIPCGQGVSIKVHKTRCGRVCAPSMVKTWSNDAYINDAYGKSETYLEIDVYITEGTLHVIQEPNRSHTCCL